MKVTQNLEKNRFEIKVDQDIAFSDYILVANRIIFTHTEVPLKFEGKGLASHLARHGLDYARKKQLQVMPLCPYIAGFIKRNPEYKDLLLPGFHVD